MSRGTTGDTLSKNQAPDCSEARSLHGARGTSARAAIQGSFHFLEGCRDLGAVLEQEGSPCPIRHAIKQFVAGSSARLRRAGRDGRGDIRERSSKRTTSPLRAATGAASCYLIAADNEEIALVYPCSLVVVAE